MPRARQKPEPLPDDTAEELVVEEDAPTMEMKQPEKPDPVKEGPWYVVGGDEDDDWQMEARNLMSPGNRRVMIRFRDRKTKKLMPHWDVQQTMHFHLSEKQFTR